MKLLIFTVLIVAASAAWPWVKKAERRMQNDDSYAHHHYYGPVNNYGDRHRDGDGHDHAHKPESKKADSSDEEIYYIAMGDDMGAYEFIDEKGFLQGFHVELLKAVCDAIGHRCHYVMAHYSDCWHTKGDREYPGEGLLEGWFTACIGYWPYPRRFNSFNFTLSFAKAQNGATFYLTERKDEFVSKDTAKGLKIGFIDGWSTSKFCLARQLGDDVDDFESVIFGNHDDMVHALKESKIDAFLSTHDFKHGPEITAGDDYACNYQNRGPAFMLKYGNPAIENLNRGLEKIYNDGTYHSICKSFNSKYGDSRGTADCID